MAIMIVCMQKNYFTPTAKFNCNCSYFLYCASRMIGQGKPLAIGSSNANNASYQKGSYCANVMA